jgi:hypothetical protein
MLQFRTHPLAMSRRGTLSESSFAAKRFLFSSIPDIRLAFRLLSIELTFIRYIYNISMK